jgi:hypothetical protein
MSETHDPRGQRHVRTRLTTPGFVDLRSSPMDWKSVPKLMAVPLVLVGIGVWLASIAFGIFPKQTQNENPVARFPIISIVLGRQQPVFIVHYDIYQISRQRWRMAIELLLDPNAPHSGSTAAVDAGAPYGATFVCSKTSQNCKKQSWAKSVLFDHKGISTVASFYLEAAHIGLDYNGPEVSAPMPEVILINPEKTVETPDLMASYYLPSALRYDWSGYPPDAISTPNGRIQWDETLNPNGFTAGRSVVGTNHAAEDDSNSKALWAGVLAGVAGAAWVGAAIEFIHARDWEALRAIRRQ